MLRKDYLKRGFNVPNQFTDDLLLSSAKKWFHSSKRSDTITFTVLGKEIVLDDKTDRDKHYRFAIGLLGFSYLADCHDATAFVIGRERIRQVKEIVKYLVVPEKWDPHDLIAAHWDELLEGRNNNPIIFGLVDYQLQQDCHCTN